MRMGEMDGATTQGGSGSASSSNTDDDDNQMNDFVNSGRTGRRNAIPEVDTHGMDPDAMKLAERLSSMNTDTDNDHECQPSESSSGSSSGSSSSGNGSSDNGNNSGKTTDRKATNGN